MFYEIKAFLLLMSTRTLSNSGIDVEFDTLALLALQFLKINVCRIDTVCIEAMLERGARSFWDWLAERIDFEPAFLHTHILQAAKCSTLSLGPMIGLGIFFFDGELNILRLCTVHLVLTV